MTRKLTIRTKLAATLAVPLVALATFAGFQVRDARNHVDRVKAQAGLATAATGPSGLLTALETERDYSALWEVGSEDLIDKRSAGEVTSVTNVKLSDFRVKVDQIGGVASDNYSAVLATMGAKLSALRKDAQQHASTNATPSTAKQADKIFDGYTDLVRQLLEVDERSSQLIEDAQLRTGAELLNAVARQDDVERQIVVKAVLAHASRDDTTANEVRHLVGARESGDARILDVFGRGAYENAIRPIVTSKGRAAIVTRLQQIEQNPLSATPKDALATLNDGTALWRNAQTVTADDFMHQRAQHLTSAAQDEQRDWIIVTVMSILLAIAMLRLANRWITRPLRSLAQQAGTLAGERLPDAVQQILAAPTSDAVTTPEVEPVVVHAGGEVGEVAAALNRVQDSAIHLAVEQAQLRGNVADAFVNLGRRNQNLLSRQLEFITQLENDESDPETLEHLFRLDHLATRMRRNAESLLVLAGHEPPRTWSAPVDIGDVVRGALGEVEGYQRVRLRHLDDARVDGTAAVDVSHVIAELVENAISFSPPDTDVEVYGRRDEFGYVLTIVDQGIGMPAEDLERANALISSANALTFAPSRFLGHYVVAQLAARHGLGVHLAASPAGGLTAMMSVPPALLGGAVAPSLPDTVVADEAPRPAIAPELPKRGASAPAPADAVVLPESEAVASNPSPVDAFEQSFAEHFEAALAAVEPEARTEPEPEPLPEPPVAAPEPPLPTRPRLGVGTFADLRAVPEPAAPRQPQPAPASDVESVAPAPLPAPAPAAVAPASDRAAAFAEVAQAVEGVTSASASSAQAPVFSEDLLPQKLPKRGRKSKGLSAPWVRDKKAAPAVPAESVVAVSPPPTVFPAPERVAAPASAPGASPSLVSHPEHEPGAEGALHFPPGGPALAGAGAPSGETPAPRPAADGEERFAFFAAFRAAAERAREEAGIDDRRVGQ